jgi:hypothetical protein
MSSGDPVRGGVGGEEPDRRNTPSISRFGDIADDVGSDRRAIEITRARD